MWTEWRGLIQRVSSADPRRGQVQAAVGEQPVELCIVHVWQSVIVARNAIGVCLGYTAFLACPRGRKQRTRFTHNPIPIIIQRPMHAMQ